MAKEKMSQTQTSTKYAEPPIKINRALYGVLLASLASVFWGSMGVCVQYIFENTKTEPQALSSLRLLLSGIVLVILNLYLSPAFVGCFFVSEGIARYCTQRH